MLSDASTKSKRKVLILGDWFVDEHWVMGIHRSSSSSRTGKGHYRSLHPTDAEVRAFCGAGRSALFLHHAKTGGHDNERVFDSLTGLGFWHRDDTDKMKCMFESERTHSPYRLKDKPRIPDEPELLNLNDALLCHQSDDKRDQYEFTNRIIRIYRETSGQTVEYERFDWEPPWRPVDWSPESLQKLRERLDDHYDVVVVKDLRKGAVTKKLIEFLAKKSGPGNNARWYVSSKKWRPDWLSDLQGVDLRLFLVPQIAAEEAVRTGTDLTCWLTKSGHLSPESLTEIDRLHEAVANDGNKTAIVVMPKGLSFICYLPSADGPQCIVQPQAQLQPVRVSMGGQSIFFPALCTYLENAQEGIESAGMHRILLHAIECTADWIHHEGQRVLNPDEWTPDPDKWRPDISLFDASVVSHSLERLRVEDEPALPWKQEVDNWTDARDNEKRGLVRIGGAHPRKELQLWRSMIEVDGYVCCKDEKRKNLRKLVHGIREFVAKPEFNIGCMLIAEPGSGKTFLMERLARAANLELCQFNITQLSGRSEIVDWFDSIQVRQEDKKDNKLLVFIDEINTDVDGTKPYSAFLSVLENGTYVRKGKTFHLRPCVWVFAGTESPQREKKDSKSTEKGSDFISRLTLGSVELKPNAKPGEEELERIYLGVSLIKAVFPDVRKVSKSVLDGFARLPDKVQVREIKHFVRGFTDIQYASVKSSNLPPAGLMGDDYKEYNRWKRDVENQLKKVPVEEADIEIVE